MKRVLLIIAVNLVIMGLIYGAMQKSKTVETVPTGEKPENVREQDFSTTDTTLLFDSSVDIRKKSAEIRDAIAYFPIDLIQAFNDNEWKIMVVTDVENEAGKSRYDLSYINFDTKAIQIKNMDTPGLTMTRTMLEMSRFADVYYGNASQQDTFTYLYNSMAPAYIEYEYIGVEKTPKNQQDLDYAKKNARNFFAVGLKDYLHHPDYVLTNYRELYTYYEALLKNGAPHENNTDVGNTTE